jgi:hypothetical protein
MIAAFRNERCENGAVKKQSYRCAGKLFVPSIRVVFPPGLTLWTIMHHKEYNAIARQSVGYSVLTALCSLVV